MLIFYLFSFEDTFKNEVLGVDLSLTYERSLLFSNICIIFLHFYNVFFSLIWCNYGSNGINIISGMIIMYINQFAKVSNIFRGVETWTTFGKLHKLIPIKCFFRTASPIFFQIMENRLPFVEMASIFIILFLSVLLGTALIDAFKFSTFWFEQLFLLAWLFRFLLLLFGLQIYIILFLPALYLFMSCTTILAEASLSIAFCAFETVLDLKN